MKKLNDDSKASSPIHQDDIVSLELNGFKRGYVPPYPLNIDLKNLLCIDVDDMSSISYDDNEDSVSSVSYQTVGCLDSSKS